MNLISKTSWVMVMSTVGLVSTLYFTVRAVQQSSFDALELENLQRDCQRVRNALQQELGALTTKCGDYSLCDESCAFIAGEAPGYVETNLASASIATLAINCILYFDANANLVHSAGVDIDTAGTCAVPDRLLQALKPGSPLFAHSGPDSKVGGILRAEPTSMLVSARPIMATDHSGPVRGTLVMARLIDAAMLEQIALVSQLPVEILPPQPGLTDWWAQALDEQRLEGRVALAGIDGSSALTARIEVPRPIHQRGTESSQMLLLVSLLVGCFGTLLTVQLLRRQVLSPLAVMRGEVLAIAGSGELERKLTVRGEDEITDFARTFNEMTTRLSQTYEQLKVAKARNEFLANVSHEIRTPLTSILGYTDVLLSASASEAECADHLQTIHRCSQHLLLLLDNLLDSAKAEHGQIVVERTRCDVQEIVNAVVDALRPVAAAKGLGLVVQLLGDTPAQITTDANRLRQILLNLVGNAVKFTVEGQVSVRLRVAGDRLRLEVDDTGPGLTGEQLAILFRPFRQADSSNTRRVGGSGLGLALSRQLAVALGGSLTCSSEPGKGSRFVCEVLIGSPADLGAAGTPRAVAVEAAAASGRARSMDPTAGSPPPVARRLEGLLVLVAEDMPDTQKLLSTILRRAGADVEVVSDGRQASERIIDRLLTGSPFDLVVMDMQMPEMNGCDATIAARRAGYRAPIIALTAHAMASDREHCLEAGCSDYRTKPIGGRALIETLADWAARSQPGGRLSVADRAHAASATEGA